MNFVRIRNDAIVLDFDTLCNRRMLFDATEMCFFFLLIISYGCFLLPTFLFEKKAFPVFYGNTMDLLLMRQYDLCCVFQ